ETVRGHRVMVTCRYLFGIDRGFVEIPLDGLAGSDLAKKCQRLAGFAGVAAVIEGSPLAPLTEGGDNLVARALGLADGNPRLLEWLDKVLTAENLDQGQILDRLAALEADQAELRELVLAESLLAQVDGDLARLLGRGKIYDLPVPREAVLVLAGGAEKAGSSSGSLAEKAGSPSVPLIKGEVNALVDRAVALGLLEVSPDGGLRVPRVVPVAVAEEERETLAKMGAECLHQLCYKNQRSSITQVSEIIRLALLGKLTDLAVSVGMVVSATLMEKGLYTSSLWICETILSKSQNYAILNQQGRVYEVLGQYKLARKYLTQALYLCPKNDHFFKNSIISNICSTVQTFDEYKSAVVELKKLEKYFSKSKQTDFEAIISHQIGHINIEFGEIDEGLVKLERSIKLCKKINNRRTLAASLTDKARVLIDQGKFKDAIPLLNEAQIFFQEIDNKINYYTTVYLLGRIALQLENLDLAICKFYDCLTYYKAEKIKLKEAATMHEIAFILLKQGKHKETLKLLHKTREIEEEIDRKSLIETYISIASVHISQKDFEKASHYLYKSLPIAQDFRRLNKIKQINVLLGICQSI
ncbi:MAG: tetratricopeptide repeat protein, partial [Limnothrix sp.]